MNPCIATLFVDAKLPILDQHFPAHPVYPGFLLLHWIRSEIERAYDVNLEQYEFVNVKFIAPALPGNTLTLYADKVMTATTIPFSVNENEAVVLKGTLHQR